MLYKTIILEVLKGSPELYEVLRRGRMLLPATESLAKMLKSRHEALKKELSTTKTGIDPTQAVSAAMEIAVKEMESRLQAEFPPDEQGRLSLEAAMASIRTLTSHA